MSDNEPEKGKKKFKMPNTYVILFGVICFIAVLSWFVPGGAYELNANGDAISGTYHIVESNPQGLWDVFMAPITGMLGSGAISGAIAISLTILLFGSFLEMMEETGAVKTALKRITMKNQNNMHLLIAILVCLMSFLGTLEGAYEEGIVYFLMFVPVILALGLDTVVAIMIVVLGTQAGCLASTVNPFATGIASGIAGISAGDGMGMRVLMLVVFTGLVIFIINRYADKVMQPLLVTLEPTDKPAGLITHAGQEFNLVLEGTVIVVIGDKEFTLTAGDSIYFNPTIPHGQRCGGDVKARFVTVIAE